jgi:hypothetical protein
MGDTAMKRINSRKDLELILYNHPISGYIVPIRYGLLVQRDPRLKENSPTYSFQESDKRDNILAMEELIKPTDFFKRETITIGSYYTED